MTKRRRPGVSKKLVEARFWGQAAGETDESVGGGDHATAVAGGAGPALLGIRPTPDPGALVRSLGPPPLAVDAEEAEMHLYKVYRAAVQAATALAAVNGLLDTDDPGA